MLGRGGRDGKNAAFVILLWVGQAGQLPRYEIEMFSAYFFVIFFAIFALNIFLQYFA